MQLHIHTYIARTWLQPWRPFLFFALSPSLSRPLSVSFSLPFSIAFSLSFSDSLSLCLSVCLFVCLSAELSLSRSPLPCLSRSLVGGSVLGHSLGALRHCVFGKLSWENKPSRSLHFIEGDSKVCVCVSVRVRGSWENMPIGSLHSIRRCVCMCGRVRGRKRGRKNGCIQKPALRMNMIV